MMLQKTRKWEDFTHTPPVTSAVTVRRITLYSRMVSNNRVRTDTQIQTHRVELFLLTQRWNKSWERRCVSFLLHFKCERGGRSTAQTEKSKDLRRWDFHLLFHVAASFTAVWRGWTSSTLWNESESRAARSVQTSSDTLSPYAKLS